MRSALATRTMAAPIGKLGKAGKAVVLRGQGSTDKLTLDKSWYCAHPGAGELMVHTVSTSVNPIDCYQRSGGAKLQFFPKVKRWRARNDALRSFTASARVLVDASACARAGAGQRRGGRGRAGAGRVAGACCATAQGPWTAARCAACASSAWSLRERCLCASGDPT